MAILRPFEPKRRGGAKIAKRLANRNKLTIDLSTTIYVSHIPSVLADQRYPYSAFLSFRNSPLEDHGRFDARNRHENAITVTVN
jgi:hypothetical protein